MHAFLRDRGNHGDECASAGPGWRRQLGTFQLRHINYACSSNIDDTHVFKAKSQ